MSLRGSHTRRSILAGLGVAAAHIKQQYRDALIEHSRYIREHGEDMPQISGWTWPYGKDADVSG